MNTVAVDLVIALWLLILPFFCFYIFRCLSSMLSTLFFPLIPWLMQLILFAWFVGVMVFLVTSGSAEYRQIENNTLTNTICSAAVSMIVSVCIFHYTTYSLTLHSFDSCSNNCIGVQFPPYQVSDHVSTLDKST